jgi:hypothetical protein
MKRRDGLIADIPPASVANNLGGAKCRPGQRMRKRRQNRGGQHGETKMLMDAPVILSGLRLPFTAALFSAPG